MESQSCYQYWKKLEIGEDIRYLVYSEEISGEQSSACAKPIPVLLSSKLARHILIKVCSVAMCATAT